MGALPCTRAEASVHIVLTVWQRMAGPWRQCGSAADPSSQRVNFHRCAVVSVQWPRGIPVSGTQPIRKPHVVEDGRLITAQNPFSAKATATVVAARLGQG